MPEYDKPVREKRPDPDKELIALLKSGAPGAFETFFDRYWRLVMKLCLAHLDDTSEAEDAAIETFTDAAKGIKNFRGEAKLSSWLLRLCLNRISKHHRRHSCEPKTVPIEGINPDAVQSESLEKEKEPEREIKQLFSDLKLLPKKERRALILRYIMEMDLPEVADVLKISVPAAGMRINRAKNRLRRLKERRQNEGK